MHEDHASDLPLMVAVADPQVQDEAADSEPRSEECLAFAKDIDADLGEVIRAGCKPTLAQMSALMDNPLGNVAMLFTQFDLYKMENRPTTRRGTKGFTPASSIFPRSSTTTGT